MTHREAFMSLLRRSVRTCSWRTPEEHMRAVCRDLGIPYKRTAIVNFINDKYEHRGRPVPWIEWQVFQASIARVVNQRIANGITVSHYTNRHRADH